MPRADTHNLPMQIRQASFAPATLNKDERTVELIWSTGARVRRYDYWEGREYFEELSLDPAHVDLSRLNNGASLLDTHQADRLGNVIGVVERAWIADGEGHALVRFSGREDVAPIVADVADGVLRHVSVGYAVTKYEVDESGAIPIYRAIAWQPSELSLVAIAADDGAATRSAAPVATPCQFISRAPAAHTVETTMPAPVEQSAAPTEAQLDAARAEAALAERTRVNDITAMCERHQIESATRAGFIASGVTLDAVRAKVLDLVAERDAAGTRPRAPHIDTLQDETEVRRAAIENAILHRARPGIVKLTDAGRRYRSMSLLEIGREILDATGIDHRGMDKLTLAQRALGTSDFPYVLANIANNTLRMGYEAAPRTFLPFCKRGSLPDFKTAQRTAMGDAPTLKKVNEHGEFTYGKIGDGKESFALATYGRIVAITRQTIINDDIGAFADVPAKFGRAAADLEGDIVWGIVTDNAALNDGVALFHATHGNLAGAGAAIAVATLSAMRAAMRVQTGLDGAKINVTPAYLLVPAAVETVAEQYTSADFVSAKASDINPFKSRLQVIAEPRLDAVSTTAWYGAADPAQIDTIEYAYLDGNDGVYIETRSGFEVDGVEIKARLDFAAKAIDYRGLYKNAGA